MTVRVVEWKKPYTWGTAIDIDENKVISLRLRDENNLIIYDAGDNEIYVDLQLPDWIKPNYAFPVWITTGRVLVADDWDVTGTLICAKTTSGDNIKILYGDDGKLYVDNGTGLFTQVYLKPEVDALLQTIWDYLYEYFNKVSNTITFFLVGTTNIDDETCQEIVDWVNEGRDALVSMNDRIYTLTTKTSSSMKFEAQEATADTSVKCYWITINHNSWTYTSRTTGDYTLGWVFRVKWSVASESNLPSSWNTIWDVYNVLDTWANYVWTWTAWDKLSETVDLSGYQPLLTAGSNININNNVISATDTTYSAGTWLSLTWTTFANTWVTSVNNNTWAVTVNEVPSGWTTDQVLTKTANGYGRANATGWIANVTTGTTTTVTGIRAGTETEYGQISTPSASVLYFTF